MESKVKLLGHPIHPMLIVFPVALLTFAVVFDIVGIVSGGADAATVSFWAMTGGLIGGLGAAVFGLIDWLAIHAGTRAKRIGAFHGLGNLAVVGLFAVSWLLRLGAPGYEPSGLAIGLSLAGILLALVTAWLGAELVYRLRIGVDDVAGADAPSSLERGTPRQLPASNPRRPARTS